MPLCTICTTTEAKYKCPACLTRTCSLACTKRHKSEAPCSGSKQAATEPSSLTTGADPHSAPPTADPAAAQAPAPVAPGKTDFRALLEKPEVLKFVETEGDNAFLKGIVRQGYYRGGWDEDRAFKAFSKALEGGEEAAVRWRKVVSEGMGWEGGLADQMEVEK